MIATAVATSLLCYMGAGMFFSAWLVAVYVQQSTEPEINFWLLVGLFLTMMWIWPLPVAEMLNDDGNWRG